MRVQTSLPFWMRVFFRVFVLCSILTGCNHLFYFPRPEILFPPEVLKLKYETIDFKSTDGTPLKGWYFPTTQKKSLGTIVQFHGNAENMTSHYLSMVWLIPEGYNVFTFDYRGYGQSSGEITQKGSVEDGVAAIQKAYEIHQKNKGGIFITWGQSLGGGILQGSLMHSQLPVSLVILDSTFTSYRKVANTVLRKSWITWLFSPLAYVLVSDRYAGIDFAKTNRVPVLVVHDELDSVVPYKNGEDLFARIQAPKTFWHPRLGGHHQTFSPGQDENRKKLVEFLSKVSPSANY